MKPVLKWLGIAAGSLIALIILVIVALYAITEPRLQKAYDVQPAAVVIPTDSGALAKGQHVATIRGCSGCHAGNLGGQVFIDVPPLARLVASNLTTGSGGVGGQYTVVDWVRAIRHGIGPDGKPLLFMPSHEFNAMSDEDVGALISYLQRLPPVNNELPGNSIRPLGRLLYALGRIPLVPAELIDHDAPRAASPVPGPTAEYGAYLVTTCTGCHGQNLSGGPIPGAPPTEYPPTNLTPDAATGIGSWTEEDFFRAIREGRRPDGSALNPEMPWPAFATMSDDELRALWLHLRRVPPLAEGNR
jgi:cytochrome c553